MNKYLHILFFLQIGATSKGGDILLQVGLGDSGNGGNVEVFAGDTIHKNSLSSNPGAHGGYILLSTGKSLEGSSGRARK